MVCEKHGRSVPDRGLSNLVHKDDEELITMWHGRLWDDTTGGSTLSFAPMPEKMGCVLSTPQECTRECDSVTPDKHLLEWVGSTQTKAKLEIPR